MQKRKKYYERVDYSDLLSELRGETDALEETKEEKPQKPPRQAQVDQAARKRASLLDRPAMKYAYSQKEKVLHDRDCEFVAGISNENFRMKESFDTGMRFCPKCYRKGLIRSGITDDGKRIAAYVRFFGEIHASAEDLRRLLIEHRAVLRWEDRDTMDFHVKEDHWKIVHDRNGYRLLHNNYIVLEDYTRHFTQGFHEQYIYGKKCFHTFVCIMCDYSWADHAEMLRQGKLEEERKKELERKKQMPNYAKIRKFSLFSYHYAILDTKEYLAGQLFASRQVKVRFGKEYEKGDLRIIFCKVRKKDEGRFLEALGEMYDKASLWNYRDYEDACSVFAELETGSGKPETERLQ